MTTAEAVTATAGTTAWLRGRWPRVLLLAAAGVAAVFALRGRVPDPAQILSIVGSADYRWLAAAVLAQTLSQMAFARQQRTLLGALAVRVSRRDALAITYSRSAMSMVLPAGSAMSAAFALREYRRHGASTAVATTGIVLSGASSIVGLTLLYAGALGTATFAPHGGWRAVALAGAWMVATALGGWAIVAYRRRGPRAGSAPRRTPGPESGRIARGLFQARRVLREARALRLRHWAATIACSVLNWLLDLCCLIAVAQACGLPLGAIQLASVYLAVQVVRQIPLTPGGVGLIEASLLAGFVAAGAPQAGAAAVVLAYRIVSFWFLLPVGLAAYLRLNRHRRRRALADVT
ncbi:lysylphosphatidylglycerol synthase transmembrane domain-containing protein [Actinoplanes sp. NPDC026623]|uniref:lysylphosphatidylglycerol synthase transmembrane domain-containing protein n=1 Tax=Actinoplanes sp. NPDC026623 TaxID=3155610 RepID=UPI00340EA6B9